MISILTLCLMVVLAVVLRPTSLSRPGRTGASRPRSAAPTNPLRTAATRSAPARTDKSPDPPGVVTYALMKDRKLPSPAQRAVRRLLRPFSGLKGWTGGSARTPPVAGPDDTEARRPSRPSAELENFLDARNREIARRKAEGATKPGPDDMLH